jgi:hypothetical protein
MDLHLNFIVNQTEQYSNWLSEGLVNQSSKGSSVGSITPDHSVAGDGKFLFMFCILGIFTIVKYLLFFSLIWAQALVC